MSKIILVVEDDDDLRTLLMDAMSEVGYTSTDASNGKYALEMLDNITFDLITLDLNMPEMDGNQFLREISKIAPATSVIVVSAQEKPLTPHPQVKAVIGKPFDIEQLLAVVEKYAA